MDNKDYTIFRNKYYGVSDNIHTPADTLRKLKTENIEFGESVLIMKDILKLWGKLDLGTYL